MLTFCPSSTVPLGLATIAVYSAANVVAAVALVAAVVAAVALVAAVVAEVAGSVNVKSCLSVQPLVISVMIE